MKMDMFESSEAFTAHATIQAGYYMMDQAFKAHQLPKDGLSILVDRATGFDKHQDTELIKYLIVCVEDIIEAKKVIDGDYSNDLKFLNELKNVRN